MRCDEVDLPIVYILGVERRSHSQLPSIQQVVEFGLPDLDEFRISTVVECSLGPATRGGYAGQCSQGDNHAEIVMFPPGGEQPRLIALDLVCRMPATLVLAGNRRWPTARARIELVADHRQGSQLLVSWERQGVDAGGRGVPSAATP